MEARFSAQNATL